MTAQGECICNMKRKYDATCHPFFLKYETVRDHYGRREEKQSGTKEPHVDKNTLREKDAKQKNPGPKISKLNRVQKKTCQKKQRLKRGNLKKKKDDTAFVTARGPHF
jgi:hypothetical protein